MKQVAKDLLSIKAVTLSPEEPLHGQVELNLQSIVITD